LEYRDGREKIEATFNGDLLVGTLTIEGQTPYEFSLPLVPSDTCTSCGGTGFKGKELCDTCDGKGVGVDFHGFAMYAW
jgi:hypothetical protein